MSYITIDPYYGAEFYNECKEALKNNEVNFTEFISIKSPFHWYIKLEETPVMVNYDEISNQEIRWLVNVITPQRANDEYLLKRRNEDSGKAVAKFINNEPLKEAAKSKYSVFFTVKNREEILGISKEFPGKIWYMGKYYNNKYRVCLSSNSMIKNYLTPEQILLEKTDKDMGRFEADLNHKVFRGNDMLLKFMETPYFQDGTHHKVSIKPKFASRFNI